MPLYAFPPQEEPFSFVASNLRKANRTEAKPKAALLLFRFYSLFLDFRKSIPLVLHSVTRLGDFLDLGNFLKPLETINLSKSLTFLGNFCKGVKIIHFSSEIISGQLL